MAISGLLYMSVGKMYRSMPVGFPKRGTGRFDCRLRPSGSMRLVLVQRPGIFGERVNLKPVNTAMF